MEIVKSGELDDKDATYVLRLTNVEHIYLICSDPKYSPEWEKYLTKFHDALDNAKVIEI